MIRRKTNKFESRRLTLEERINRLERALTSNRKACKFEGFDLKVDLKHALDKLLDPEWYNVDVRKGQDGILLVDVSDNSDSGWDIDTTFGVEAGHTFPAGVETFVVTVREGDHGEYEMYELGTVNSLDKAVSLIANEIATYEADE